ncbi:unnamed protein product, partial [Brenthis ino]
MLINTFLDTEDFVHLYYPEDEPPTPQGCGAGARLASKYPRPPTPEYKQDLVIPIVEVPLPTDTYNPGCFLNPALELVKL